MSARGSIGGWQARAGRAGPYLFLLALAAGALAISATHLLVPFRDQAPSVAVFAGERYAQVQLPAFARRPTLVRTHAVLGAVFAMLAPFQFWKGFRAKHRRVHRMMGYAAMADLTLLAVTGLAVSIVYPFAGMAAVLPNIVWMAAILGCTGAALANIRRRRVAAHEAWVTRASAIALGIVLSRLYLLALEAGAHMPSAPALALVFWLGAGTNLALAEAWLQWRRTVVG